MYDWKYNYIILGSDWDLYKFSYSDLNCLSNVVYLPGPKVLKSSLLDKVRRVHFNVKLNSWISLPCKKYWNKFYLSKFFSDNKPLCFIVFNNWIAMETGFIEFIKSCYPQAKIVWMCQDLISTEKYRYSRRPFDIKKISSNVDLALSFDYGDCERYSMIHYPLVFSSFHDRINQACSCDIYFLGKAKERLTEIVKIYDLCEGLGLICDFNVVGVEANSQIQRAGIHYIHGMSYSENLQHIAHSKCLLEVMQKNGRGYTQRACEAVCLDKLLITNNKDIANAPFYNSSYISIFDQDRVDVAFLENIRKNKEIDYNYKENMSPINLLRFIENMTSI